MAADISAQGEAAPSIDGETASRQSQCAELQAAESPVLMIPIDQIDRGSDRLRSFKQEQADAIGAAIVADGQYDPISVCRLPGQTKFLLVDGLHRLEGCRAQGFCLIQARIVDANRQTRVRQEILSGVARATHDVFDKAAQIAALAAMAREAAGKPAIGDLRSLNGRSLQAAISEAAIDLELSSKSLHWSEKTAEDFDIGPRQVRKYALISARFSPENIDLLRTKKLADQLGALINLASLEPAQFERALDFIADQEKPTIAEALEHVMEVAKPTPFNKKFNKFIGWVDDLDVRERKLIMAELIAKYDLNGKPLKTANTNKIGKATR